MSRAAQHDLVVVGLGYVGLPLAIEATRAGLSVGGYDIDETLVGTLREGRSHIEDVTHADVSEAVQSGFWPSASPRSLADTDAVAICVPTPLTNHVPDLAAVISASETIGSYLSDDQLIVLESTSYPGTTEEVMQPILEQRSGLRAGKDFLLAYSPERIDPGNSRWDLRNTPKLVGGIDERSAARATALYGKICTEVVTVSGTREAEMAKLLENTYRSVNIALVNELAIFCRELGIDFRESIRAAATKPFGFQAFFPGPGVGGHCIPIDPSYFSYSVRQLGYPSRFVELAQEINARMPQYVASRAARLLNKRGQPVNGSRILLLGVAYKPDVSDVRETPARGVAEHLRNMGADLSFVDPHVEVFEVAGRQIERRTDPVAAARDAALVIILTPHSAFDLEAVCDAASLVFDTRGAVPAGKAEYL